MNSDKATPFAAIDFGAFDATKMLDSLRTPGVDWQALMDSRARNIAALSQANERAAEGLRAIVRTTRPSH